MYLYVQAELLDNSCDSQNVILQQFAGKRLDLDGALRGLQTCCYFLFDPESLLQQHGQRDLLTTETTLQSSRPSTEKQALSQIFRSSLLFILVIEGETENMKSQINTS